MSADPYASRAYDDAFEPLCTAPDELPPIPPAFPEDGDLSSLPVLDLTSVMPGVLPGDGAITAAPSSLFAAAADIARSAATSLPPAMPETV